jgi:hypothetical protein
VVMQDGPALMRQCCLLTAGLAAKTMQRARAQGGRVVYTRALQHGTAITRTAPGHGGCATANMHVVAMPPWCGDSNVPRCTYDAQAAAKLGHEIEGEVRDSRR